MASRAGKPGKDIEMSPPSSQPSSTDNTNPFPSSPQKAPTQSQHNSRPANSPTESQEIPEDVHAAGYTWNNKRAREEFGKAWEQVVDKNWNMRNYGDPFDEVDMELSHHQASK